MAVGDRVIAMTPHGGYAEQVIADGNRCVSMPAAMPGNTVRLFRWCLAPRMLPYGIGRGCRLARRWWCMAPAAASGLTAVAIGKQLGATVIATANGLKSWRWPRTRRGSSD
jgi:NADPH2:quinone reductase